MSLLFVSVGPDRINLGAKESWHWMKGTNNYHMCGVSNYPICHQTLRANTKMIDKYGVWLNKLEKNGSLIYSLELSSCVTRTQWSLICLGFLILVFILFCYMQVCIYILIQIFIIQWWD